MKISYAITVCNEYEEIVKLVECNIFKRINNNPASQILHNHYIA